MEVGEPIIDGMPNSKDLSPRVGEFPREILLSSWGGESGRWWNAAKRGQNCNNSCLLLRNTECFPAIWINKHSLVPLGPRLSLTPIGWLQERHQQCCPPATCFQLTVMKQEITANLTFLAMRRAALCPKLLSKTGSLARRLCVSVHTCKTHCMDSCKMLFNHTQHWSFNVCGTRDVVTSPWLTTFLYLVTPDETERIAIKPRTAIVGDNVILTCRASRYLYTDLQWLDSRNQTVTSSVSSLKFSNYSISRSLHLHNVSKNSTTGYKCEAYKFNNRSELKTAALSMNGK